MPIGGDSVRLDLLEVAMVIVAVVFMAMVVVAVVVVVIVVVVGTIHIVFRPPWPEIQFWVAIAQMIHPA